MKRAMLNNSLICIMILIHILFFGCSKTEKTDDDKQNKRSVGLILAVGGLGDNSVNDSAHIGLERAKSQLDVETKFLEPRETAEFDEHLRLFGEQGTDLVIGIGYSMKGPIEKISKFYPDTIFAIIDVPATGDNVLSLVFREHEGAYLAGQLAALKSESNKVGFIGGMDIPLLRKWQKGYEEGAKSINREIIVDSRYIDVKVQGFSDPVKGKAMALSMYSGGVDVLLQVTGGSASGVYSATREKNKFAIGSDQNQDDMVPGLVLTSVVRDVEQIVFQTIDRLVKNKLKGGVLSFGLKENGIHLTDFSNTKETVGQSILNRIQDTKEQIIDGRIKVIDYTEKN